MRDKERYAEAFFPLFSSFPFPPFSFFPTLLSQPRNRKLLGHYDEALRGVRTRR